MKTSELKGAALDWAVDKAQGKFCLYPYAAYSTDWAKGGPIIEREGICLSCVVTMAPWDARIYVPDEEPWQAKGTTPLIAAMRCFVASKLGNTVDIPKELTP
jgi:hypothetical protein